MQFSTKKQFLIGCTGHGGEHTADGAETLPFMRGTRLSFLTLLSEPTEGVVVACFFVPSKAAMSGFVMLCPATVARNGAVVSAPRSRNMSRCASAKNDGGAVPHRQCDATTNTTARMLRRVVAVRRSGPRGGSVAVRASGIEQAISDLATGVGLPCTVSGGRGER